MREIPTCLQNLVGVSDTTCDCFTDDRPEGYAPGTSGKNVADLIDLQLIRASGDCSNATVWEVAQQAIDEATQRFIDNITAFWAERHTTREFWNNFLTKQKSANGAFAPAGTYAGLRFTPRQDVRYGEIEIVNLGTYFNQTGTLTVYVYDSIGLLYTFSGGSALDTTANTYQANPITVGVDNDPLILPFHTKGRPDQYFDIIFQVSGNLPIKNEMICRSCSPALARHLEKWGTVRGITGNDLEARDDWSCSETDGYGLVPEVKIRCRSDEGICIGGMEMGVDPNAGIIAEAIWYLAGARLAYKLRTHPSVNQFTLLDGDALADKEAKYNAVAKARMEVIANSELALKSGCFECVQSMQTQSLSF